MGFGHGVASIIYRWGWGNNSPLLIINTILLFMIFTKLTIKVKLISVVAKSVFPIYLIHSNLNVQKILWPLIQECFNTDNLILRNFVLSVCIMLLCVDIDKFLAPIYGMISTYLIKKYKRLVLYENKNCICFSKYGT